MTSSTAALAFPFHTVGETPHQDRGFFTLALPQPDLVLLSIQEAAEGRIRRIDVDALPTDDDL